MMIIEMREAAYEKAFRLLDEMKELSKQKKMVMCELEDTLYECYESSKQGDEDEYEDMGYDEPEMEMDLRRSRNYRRRAMSRNMRHEDDYEDDEKMHGHRMNRGMRRRNRLGRYI